MTVQFTSREFNQQIARARRAASDGPVFVTDRGKLKQVLLSIEDYRRLTARRPSLGELLSNPEVAEIDFELPPRTVQPFHNPFDDDAD